MCASNTANCNTQPNNGERNHWHTAGRNNKRHFWASPHGGIRVNGYTLSAVALVIGFAIYKAMHMADSSATTDQDPIEYPQLFEEWAGNTTPPPADNWSGEVYTPADLERIPVEGDNQLPTVSDTVFSMDFGTFMNTSTTSASPSEPNVRAFLDMIAYSEGTEGPEGYRFMFGYPQKPERLCASLVDHPRQSFEFTVAGKTQRTTAAGRYQFLMGTWDELKARLKLPDFGPASQDAAAIELIRQRGALPDIRAGRVSAAISKCAKTWASLPGAGYGQPERKIASLVSAYTQAGGTTLTA